MEVFTRSADGRWTLDEATAGTLTIPKLDLELALDEVYAGFDELAENEEA